MVFCSSNPKEAVESPLKVSKSTFVRVHYSLIISLIFQDFFFYLAHLRLIVKLTSAVSKLKKKTKKKNKRKLYFVYCGLALNEFFLVLVPCKAGCEMDEPGCLFTRFWETFEKWSIMPKAFLLPGSTDSLWIFFGLSENRLCWLGLHFSWWNWELNESQISFSMNPSIFIELKTFYPILKTKGLPILKPIS